MTSTKPLENLVRTGKLKHERPGRVEIQGLLQSAEARLGDAAKLELSLDSRFDLAYNAAHALALAALRALGYRSDSRYLVFQVLPHTLDMPTATWRLLAKCHDLRNRAEYEGIVDLDNRLVDGLIAAASQLLEATRSLELPPEPKE